MWRIHSDECENCRNVQSSTTRFSSLQAIFMFHILCATGSLDSESTRKGGNWNKNLMNLVISLRSRNPELRRFASSQYVMDILIAGITLISSINAASEHLIKVVIVQNYRTSVKIIQIIFVLRKKSGRHKYACSTVEIFVIYRFLSSFPVFL